MEDKVICSYCNKKIIPFKLHKDWISRKYHRSCWQKKSDDFTNKEMMERYLRDNPKPLLQL